MQYKNIFTPTAVVVMFLALTGVVSAYAEQSVPGSLLYNIKTQINEPVASVFAFTKEEKTEWKERIIERRLEEAQKLISNNSLDEVKRVALENEINKEVNEFNSRINELAQIKDKSLESSNINIRLQASLNAYQNVLEKLSGLSGLGISEDTKKETVKLLAAVTSVNNTVKDNHKSLEQNIGTSTQNQDAGTDTLATASEKINAAKELLNSIKLVYQKEKMRLSLNIQNEINKNLAKAEGSLQEAQDFINTNNFTNSTTNSQIAISAIGSARLLLLSNIINSDIKKDMGVTGLGFDDDIYNEEDAEEDDEDEYYETEKNEERGFSDDEYEYDD